MAKIGIDFGTSYTTLSRINLGTGNAEPIRINGKEKIPTMVFFPEDGDSPSFGEQAYNIYKTCLKIKNLDKACRLLAGLYSDLKTSMNLQEQLFLPNGRSFSYAEMIGEFLKYLKNEVESTTFQGETVTDVCVTYPVNFEEFKKNILREAALYAGFSNIKMLMEPVSAAMGYKMTEESESGDLCRNKSILVYDFGGGTFDLAFVKFDANGNHITLPPRGDLHCGGQDIDKIIYDEWDKLVFSETNGIQHISDSTGMVNAPFLKTTCMENKEELSEYFKVPERSNAKSLYEDVANDYRELRITRQKWEDMVAPIINRTISLTKEYLAYITEQNYTVDKVILIGGSSRISVVYEKLNEIPQIKGKIVRVADLDVAVANGAAIFANQQAIAPQRCFCRMCGKELDTSMKFCRYCGVPNFRYDFRFADNK